MKRALVTGTSIVVLGAMLIASPLVLGSGEPMKYVVTAGIVGACLGLSMLLHAAWDLLAARFRKP